jgi:hypothetical protein
VATVTRLSSLSESLRQARGRLSRSWEATQSGWKDRRAREFEERHQQPLERATLSFERSLARLDGELGAIDRDLPRD